MILTSAWIILGLPLLTAVLISLFLLRSPKAAGILGTAGMLAAFALTCSLIPQYTALQQQGQFVLESSLPWLQAGTLSLDFGVYFNGLSLVMLLVVTGIGTLVFLFSTAYMAGDPGYSRYFACLSFFTFSMLGIVLANNLIQIFIFWELVGLSSYLLIGFWFEKKEACTAAKKAFMTTRVGDAGMILGILGLTGFLAAGNTGSLNFTAVAAALPSLAIPEFWMTLIALGIFLGVVGKSAQVPLHVWLPDAMEGPTPVSALIHAATMVAAGIFLLARVFFIFEASPSALQVIAWTGGITAFLAASLALVQTDIKKILAYSTVSQLGYMVMALGLSNAEAGIFHLTMHAFFKALLFLGAGSLIHAFHSQNIWDMGARVQAEGGRFYLFKAMPFTSFTFLIGTLALMGIPPLSGFYSKEAILAAASHSSAPLFTLAMITVFLTAFYNGRLFTLVFLPAKRSSAAHDAHAHPLHEGGPAMVLPLVILAVLSVFGASLPVKEWLAAAPHAPHGAAHHGFDSLAILSLAAAAAGFLLAAGLYFKRTQSLRQSVKVLAAPGKVLDRKYFFDEVYDRVISGGQDKAARYTDVLERYAFVEWTVNGLGRITRSLGDQLRRLQTGIVQFYGFVIVVGVTAILYIFMAGRM